MVRLNCIDISKIAVMSYRSTRTVERVYSGGPCRAPTHLAIKHAAARLKLPLPPPRVRAQAHEPAASGG